MLWFKPPLTVGTQAPDFSAPDQDGKQVKLSALRGRNVILVFYPADNTSVCTQQLCEFRDAWADACAKNTMVFGVNPAPIKTHERFRNKHKFPFPLLMDKGQEIGKMYQAYSWVAPRRTVYLIGPDGVIRYAQRGKPSPEEVLAAAA